MPGLFDGFFSAAFWNGTVTAPEQGLFDLVNGVERYNLDWSGNEQEAIFDPPLFISGSPGAAPAEVGSGFARLQTTQHSDYHFRFWLVPNSFNLSNPTLDADIPFTIWNTFQTPQTLSSIGVVGSSVLTFDLTPGTVVPEFAYISTAFQIGAGEPTIDAAVTFNFTSGEATFLVRALVATTFSIIPEVPIKETWAYETDTLKSWNGYESRLSLMEQPRVSLDMSITLVDFADRRELYDLIASAIRVPSLVPLFQYATPLTADTAIGGSRLYFDCDATNMRVGVYVAVINRVTRQVVLGRVTTIYADGVDLESSVGIGLTADPPLWFAMPSLPCFLEDETGISFGTQSGSFSLRARALGEFDLVRPNSTRTVSTYDGLPVLEWPLLITTDEKFSYRRDLLDGGVGARAIRSRDIPVEISRTFKFSADRTTDDLDYFRTFYSTVRGSQKPFLMSTQLPDLIPVGTITQGTGTLVLDRIDYVSKFFPFDAFKRIEVIYGNGDSSYHNVTSATIDDFGVASITISPSLINDPDYTSISRISYLQKCKASDTLQLEHFNDYSYVRFKAQTVEF